MLSELWKFAVFLPLRAEKATISIVKINGHYEMTFQYFPQLEIY